MAYGPLYEVPEDSMRAARGKVAALEKAITEALRAAKYQVVHPDPKCRFKDELAKLSEVLTAFAKYFPRLSR